jgi:hypothetical protein
MKKLTFFLLVIFASSMGLISCVSLKDRPAQNQKVLETVSVTFTSYQPLHIISKEKIKEKAYSKLLEQAKLKYQGEIDIANIEMKGHFSFWNVLSIPPAFYLGGAGGVGIMYVTKEPEGLDFLLGGLTGGTAGVILSGNFQRITVTGEIIAKGEYRALSQSARNSSDTRMTTIQRATHKASDVITPEIPKGSKIAVLNIESADKNISEQVMDELEYIFVSSKNFTMVDRRTLASIMAEQNFQSSGNVDEKDAVSIGKMAGASIVITGAVSGTGSSRRLMLRVLDVKTGQIITMARESF